jgi:hypothetical protein
MPIRPGSLTVCDGHRATVRISDITATGTAKGFMDAVAAHRAWLMSHGLTTVPVIVRDEQTRFRSYSDKQLWSIHIHGSKDPEPKHDEAHDAFVKMYRDQLRYQVGLRHLPPEQLAEVDRERSGRLKP